MLIFMFIVICIAFVKIRTAGKNEFFEDYCSREQTTSINGLFVIIIFIGHIAQRLLKIPDGPMTDPLSAPYITFRSYMDQLVVVPFLLYSGYGIMESIKKKGKDYVKGIPTKRFFKVWYHLALVVTLFLVQGLILGKSYDASTILLSYIGWKNVGGSNWYIFVTLAMYLAVFVSFMLLGKFKPLAVTATAALLQALPFSVRYERSHFSITRFGRYLRRSFYLL